jgi:L-ascorbate metabolism protein UlaG (beta-lactamase superfamily)
MAFSKRFQNLSHTTQFAEGVNMWTVIKSQMGKKVPTNPPHPVPSEVTDLKSLHTTEPSFVWFGHSSYLIHRNGLNILVDPVLSGYASPVSFLIKAFPGSDVYKPHHMPKIDVLVLTHNHYDHLDRRTLKVLAPEAKIVVAPLGVKRDLKGIPIAGQQVELSWWQSQQLLEGVTITSTPARHFSGRSLARNTSLWTSYVLDLHGHKIFIGGDSGYDTHFSDIGNSFGTIDTAILECGQYDPMWPYIHSFPEQVVQESHDLNAKHTIPVHWGKFALANHAWDDSINRFKRAADAARLNYTVPVIGKVESLLHR